MFVLPDLRDLVKQNELEGEADLLKRIIGTHTITHCPPLLMWFSLPTLSSDALSPYRLAMYGTGYCLPLS